MKRCWALGIQSSCALQGLKENLNPIDDEERLVLLSAVADSMGAEGAKMSNIRVLSSASVAETLSVTLVPPEGQAGQPREVIVKLLRPGIVERAGRERAFFERVAAERGQAAGGGDGLVRTMASIADQIESRRTPLPGRCARLPRESRPRQPAGRAGRCS